MNIKAIILKRIDIWRAGNTIQLWEQAKDTRKRARSAHLRASEFVYHNRVLNLVQEGAMAKAIRVIDSHGVHPATDKIAEDLRRKHPQSTPINEGLTDFDDHIPFKPPTPMEKVTAEEVTRAIRKFLTASAGGGSLLTPGHMKQMAACSDATLEHGFIDSLNHLCSTLLRGEIPDDLLT